MNTTWSCCSAVLKIVVVVLLVSSPGHTSPVWFRRYQPYIRSGAKDERSAADAQIEMDRNDGVAHTMWLATDRDALREARSWKDGDEATPWNSVGRQRRSGGRQRQVGDSDVDESGRYVPDYEQNIENNIRSRKRHRRPPVDPTLLMMGIGRRK